MLLRTFLKMMLTSICIFSATELVVAGDVHQESPQKKSSNPEILEKSDGAIPAIAHEEKAKASMPETASSQSTHPDLEVIEFVLTTKVEGREPIAIVENFSKENGMAYAFARIHAKSHAQVTFVWFRDGKEQSRFTTNVHAAKRWRTYASIKLRPGNWKVQLLSPNNEVLVERPFTVD